MAPTWDGIKEGEEDADVVTEVVRLHEMNPASDENLKRFRVAFDRAGYAYLGIAVMPPDLSPQGVRHIGSAPLSAITIRPAADLRDGDWEVAFMTLVQDDENS